jgi:hypothetical protein
MLGLRQQWPEPEVLQMRFFEHYSAKSRSIRTSMYAGFSVTDPARKWPKRLFATLPEIHLIGASLSNTPPSTIDAGPHPTKRTADASVQISTTGARIFVSPRSCPESLSCRTTSAEILELSLAEITILYGLEIGDGGLDRLRTSADHEVEGTPTCPS